MEVEDFTGKGLNDLQQHRIETPLPPLETFTDDPLRILRVIRFATRFGYQVADDIYEATKNEAILRALETKLSRERIGVEVHKMLIGKNPLRAIELLCDFNCYHSTFTTPPEVLYSKADIEKCLKMSRILNKLLSNGILDDIAWISDLSNKELIGRLYLATAISPYANSHFKQKLNANSQFKQIQTSKYIIGTSLKLSVHQSEFITGLLSHADKISELVFQNYTLEFNRKTAGLLIRELGQRPIGHNWDLCILISLTMDIYKFDLSVDKSEKEFRLVLDRYSKFMKDVFLHQLQNSYDLKSIIDGKRVAKLLGIKPGPKVGVILQQLIEWQLLNGGVTEEEAIVWLKGHFQE
jgi:tRNA nucleotidyltransferase (CCA-adding enzyme)